MEKLNLLKEALEKYQDKTDPMYLLSLSIYHNLLETRLEIQKIRDNLDKMNAMITRH